MNVVDGIQWVSRSVLSNRQRSTLTMLGIAIGITAVALLTSVGEGLRLYLYDSFSQFGTRIIAVSPGKVSTQGMTGLLNSTKPLTIKNAEALRTIPYVEAVVPVVNGTGRIEAGQLARNTNIIGVNFEAASAWGLGVALGRFLPDDEASSARAYTVLGAKLRSELYGQTNPVGQLIRISGMRFKVIGVMQSKGQMLGFDFDDMAYIPTAIALQLFNRDSVMEIDISFSEHTTAEHISERIKQRLIAQHSGEDFTLFSQQDMLQSLNRILRFLTLAIAALGSISLFVGGVGVLTIMTTTLKERTAEIGLLSALGGTRRQTLLLYLGEAILLASSGGIVGILLAIAVVLITKQLVPNIPLTLDPAYLVLAWSLSMIIGLLAGIAPAIHASRLNPIEALRDE